MTSEKTAAMVERYASLIERSILETYYAKKREEKITRKVIYRMPIVWTRKCVSLQFNIEEKRFSDARFLVREKYIYVKYPKMERSKVIEFDLIRDVNAYVFILTEGRFRAIKAEDIFDLIHNYFTCPALYNNAIYRTFLLFGMMVTNILSKGEDIDAIIYGYSFVSNIVFDDEDISEVISFLSSS